MGRHIEVTHHTERQISHEIGCRARRGLQFPHEPELAQKCADRCFSGGAGQATKAVTKRIYEASERHCEPITAQNPGVKCPKWSVEVAQELLDSAFPVGRRLQATHGGVGFVGMRTRTSGDVEIWHGYPEAWDKMDQKLKQKWLEEGLISKKDLRTYRTRENVRDAFGGRKVGK